MKLYIGVDLGTSAVKLLLMDAQGEIKNVVSKEYPLEFPQPGWSQQNPEDWRKAVMEGIPELLSGFDGGEIAGIGCGGQMHGLVVLDKDDNVIRPAILWNDGRTAKQVDYLNNIIGKDKLSALTANIAFAGFTAPKILWMKENEPDNYGKIAKIMLPKDYVNYILTGVHACDYSDASGMLLMDVEHKRWSKEMLDICGVTEDQMPKLFESFQCIGTVKPEIAKALGIGADVQLAAGAGDNAAAAVGTGTVRYGKAFTTLGTSGVVFAHADSVSIDPAGRVHTFCSAVPGKWAVMSCTLAAGQSLRWLRDTCCAGEVAEAARQGVDPYELMTALAEKTPIGADGLLFLPYLMGERSPLLDEKARGAFIGLSGGHGRGHLIRAVLEGVTYSQRQCVDVLRGMNVPTEEMMACGGGARSAFWRQMLADVYGCPIQTAKAALEGPALGVAILAGVGTGVYPSVESACDAIVKPDTVLYPDAECGRAYEPYYQLYLRQYPALRETFHALAAMRSRA